MIFGTVLACCIVLLVLAALIGLASILRARDDARLSQLLATLDRSWKARVRVDVNPRGGL